MRVRQGVIGINLYEGEFGGIHNFKDDVWKFDWKSSMYATDMASRKPKDSNSRHSSYLMSLFSTPMTYTGLAAGGNRYLNIDSPANYQGDSYRNLNPNLGQYVTPNDMMLSQLMAIDMGSYERDWVGEFNLEHKPSDKLKGGAKFKTKYLERGHPMNIYAYLGGSNAPISMGSLEGQPFPYNGGFLTELGNTYNNVMMPGISLNQSKHIFNAALFYEKGKTVVRVAGNYKGDALPMVQGNPENYRWYGKNFTVDLSASYKISNKSTIFLEVNNLTNEPLKYFQGNANRPEQLEYYSTRGMLGINLNLF